MTSTYLGGDISVGESLIPAPGSRAGAGDPSPLVAAIGGETGVGGASTLTAG